MLERAKEFLQVAELAMEKRLHNGCAANCYYAFLWAASLAMKHAGFKQQKWPHVGLRASFNEELIHKRHIYPPQFAKEDLDAWIGIVVPDEKEEIVSETLSQRRYEIFTEEGYDIGLGIIERSQYEAVHSKSSVMV